MKLPLKRENDKEALGIMHEYGKHIAALVKMIVLTVDPQAIIFGVRSPGRSRCSVIRCTNT